VLCTEIVLAPPSDVPSTNQENVSEPEYDESLTM